MVENPSLVAFARKVWLNHILAPDIVSVECSVIVKKTLLRGKRTKTI